MKRHLKRRHFLLPAVGALALLGTCTRSDDDDSADTPSEYQPVDVTAELVPDHYCLVYDNVAERLDVDAGSEVTVKLYDEIIIVELETPDGRTAVGDASGVQPCDDAGQEQEIVVTPDQRWYEVSLASRVTGPYHFDVDTPVTVVGDVVFDGPEGEKTATLAHVNAELFLLIPRFEG